ncbi:MAG: hypothetical protein HY722_14120 [Planctomycetes bacterium]|nr:hypothetical protein [Planctomycetota bacterium]
MSPEDLAVQVREHADRLEKELPDISREDLELILWGFLRERADPFDFLLQRVGPDAWAL